MNGVWGKSRRSNTIHFYPGGGTSSLCGMATRLDLVAPAGWDENQPDSCENCKKQMRWFKLGFRPADVKA